MFRLWPARPQKPAQRYRRAEARPGVEELERRDVPSALTPAQVRHAYGFDQIRFGNVAGNGSGQTIAVIDAYNAPNIATDLHTFDRTFGLPDPPRFMKVNQTGGSTLPSADADWALETSLDVEWAHAIAPGANILLVEADSDNLGDLLAAVDYARNQRGVVAVSMSWSSPEFPDESAYDGTFSTPAGHVGGGNLPGGVTFVASSGDDGAANGPSWPGVAPSVLSVGGTHLSLTATGNYLGETGWGGSGGGTSTYESEPGYQVGVQGSGRRTDPDVAYNADPGTGVYVLDTYPQSDGSSGWFQVGGTSAGAPQWAALVAIADQGRALVNKGSLDGRSQTLPMLYAMPAANFHDVTAGSNGYPAGPGYDLVTGRGSPVAPLVVRYLAAGPNAGTFTMHTSALMPAGRAISAGLEHGSMLEPDLPSFAGSGAWEQAGAHFTLPSPNLLSHRGEMAALTNSGNSNGAELSWTDSILPGQPTVPTTATESAASDQAFALIGVFQQSDEPMRFEGPGDLGQFPASNLQADDL